MEQNKDLKRRLSLDETIKYLKAWRELKDENALLQLFLGNDLLIKYFANKYSGKGLEFDELLSAGKEGFLRAINAFDYKNREIGDIKIFSSYIAQAIDNQIKMDLRKYNKHKYVLSLEEPIYKSTNGDEITIKDSLVDDVDMIDNLLNSICGEKVRDILLCLNPKEKQIILLRYGLFDGDGKTLVEIANIVGGTKQSVAVQEQRALAKMRRSNNLRLIKELKE